MLPPRRISATRFLWTAAASAEIGQIPLEGSPAIVTQATAAIAWLRAPDADVSVAGEAVTALATAAIAWLRAPDAVASIGADARIHRRRSTQHRRRAGLPSQARSAVFAGAVIVLPEFSPPPRHRRR